MIRKAISLHGCVIALFVITVAGFLAVPIWDIDFWWHIASGRNLLTQGVFPTEDPFHVYLTSDLIRKEAYLNSQWGGQSILYLVFESFGVHGVILLRVGAIVSALLLIYFRSRMLEVSVGARWIVLVLAAGVMAGYTGDRPQLLSFLFAGLLFLVVDLFAHKGNARWLLFLPALTLLWANCHGAFVLGLAALGVYWIARTPTQLGSEQAGRRPLALLAAAIAACALASLLTPSGLGTYEYVLQLEGSLLQGRTSEYLSPFLMYRLGELDREIWIAAFYLVGVFALWGVARKAELHGLLIIIFLGAVGATAYRYVPFFVIIAGPYIAQGLDRGLRRWFPFARRLPALWGELALAFALAVILAVGIQQERIFGLDVDSDRFPVDAVHEIQRLGLSGKTFNHINWGGYLLWHLDPQVRIYIDGRLLDTKRLIPYTHILWATPEGIRWFQQERFDLVVMPAHGPFDPEPYKLHAYLRTLPDWRVVYRAGDVAVYRRVGGS